MRIFRALIVWSTAAGCVCAQMSTSTTVGPTPTTFRSTAVTQAIAPTGTAPACLQVRNFIASQSSNFPPSMALACLESVPLNVTLSLAFINYVKPYLYFQSTLEYLKNPPTGYLFPGVDIFKGLQQIQTNLANLAYKSQWDFEKDMFYLINVMPHDFHLALVLPLVNFFRFRRYISLVSISSDGISLPQVYFQNDLLVPNPTSWKPSPLISIDGRPVADYLKNIGETTTNYQDPDGIYNLLFQSVPGIQQRRISNFDLGANFFGLQDTTNYSFANGSSITLKNFASSIYGLANITTGEDLFSVREVPPPSTVMTSGIPTVAVPTISVSTTTQVSGYPTPVVLHSNGYTGGYFIPSSEVAVLVITAFSGTTLDQAGEDLEQQSVIQKFLAACKAAGKTKLIVDLSLNGGGAIFSSYDAFTQIFPAKVPFGGSRLRATPELNYLGEVISAAGPYKIYEVPFQTDGQLDVNLRPFPNWEAFYGPVSLYGDNFTAEQRYDLNDVPLTILNGISVSGYGNRTNVSAQVFSSDNIIMLQDGTCGSACALFAEFMKSQGGVRSVVVGGRPQNGPMQGIGGSKGAQEFNFPAFRQILLNVIPEALALLTRNNQTLPPLPPPEFILSNNSHAPLGATNFNSAGLNLRNSYREGDSTNTPLQFIYEAGNCRIFYKAEDLVDYSAVWTRVAAVTWGNGTCVPGSSINANNTIPRGAFDTVPFSAAALASVNYSMLPGSLTSNVTNTTSSMNSATATATPFHSGAARKLKANSWLAMFIFLAGPFIFH